MTEEQATAGGEARGCFCMGAGPEFSQMFRKMGPGADARRHFRNARIEILKGIRSFIDERIETLSRPEQKGAHVNVE